MIKLLLKNRFKSLIYGIFARTKGQNAKKPSLSKIVLFSALYLYLAFAFVFLSSSLAISLGSVLIPIGASWLYFAMITLITASVVFVLGVFETKTEIFDGCDNELLLSMPIKPRDIVASRLITVCAFNLLETAVAAIPAAIVYLRYSNYDVLGAVGALLTGVLTCVFATALSSGVGYLLSLLTKRMKSKTLFTVLLSLAFIFLYMLLYSKLVSGFETFIEDLANSVENIKQNYGILYYIGNASLLDWRSLLLLFFITAAVGTLAYCLISKSFISLADSSHGSKKSVYKAKKTSRKSVIFALTKRELLKFKSSAVYILNSSIGLIFELIFAVFLLVRRDVVRGFFEELTMNANQAAPILILMLLFTGSMNMMSASALSLEGENLWIVKSLPTESKTVLLSKALPHIVISSLPALLSSVITYIASGSSIYFLPFFIIIPQIFNVYSAFFGLVLNVAFPKFSYQNEAQVVKQSLPVFLVMLSQTLLCVMLLFLNLFAELISPLLAVFATAAVLLLLALVFGLVLFYPSAKKYARIEV